MKWMRFVKRTYTKSAVFSTEHFVYSSFLRNRRIAVELRFKIQLNSAAMVDKLNVELQNIHTGKDVAIIGTINTGNGGSLFLILFD